MNNLQRAYYAGYYDAFSGFHSAGSPVMQAIARQIAGQAPPTDEAEQTDAYWRGWDTANARLPIDA